MTRHPQMQAEHLRENDRKARYRKGLADRQLVEMRLTVPAKHANALRQLAAFLRTRPAAVFSRLNAGFGFIDLDYRG